MNTAIFAKSEDEEEANEIFSDNQSRIDMYTDRVSIAFYILWVILIVLYVYLIARSTAGFVRLRKKYEMEK